MLISWLTVRVRNQLIPLKWSEKPQLSIGKKVGGFQEMQTMVNSQKYPNLNFNFVKLLFTNSIKRKLTPNISKYGQI